LLLLNILLFAQGNLGAGKRGSRDREGHSVRFIYKEICVGFSHPQRKEASQAETEAKEIKLKNGLCESVLSRKKEQKIQKNFR
jgi:hypothetical protein